MKKVSIIIPVYNIAAYLRQCVDSLLSQTYSALEIILVDDGSKDESGKICDQYAQNDSRVVVIHQKNAGAANAKNAGLDRATGQYITFMDSDDYAEPHWIETQLRALERTGADVVECDFDKIYVNRNEIANNYQQECLYTAEEYLGQYLSNWTCSLFWNKLFRAELVRNVRFRRERRCIDDEFFTYKAVSGAKKIVRITDVLYHYRQRASSAVSSAANRLQIAEDSLEILVERYLWISSKFPKLRRQYLAHDADVMIYYAGKFDFSKATIKKFRKMAGFYLKECFLHGRDKVTWLCALRLPFIKLQSQSQQAVTETDQNLEDYFA